MILVIGHSTTYESKRLMEELEKKKIDFKWIQWKDIVLPLKEVPELCVLRGSIDLETHFIIPYTVTIIEEFERMGCITVPPSRMITKCDKASTYLLWRKYLKNVIKMPETMITINMDEGIKFLKSKKLVVFKPIVGGLGKGVELLKGNEVEKLEKLKEKHGIIHLQEFIPNKNYDIRTIFIGNEFTTQYLRFNEQDFRHNIHCGGVGKTIEEMDEIDPNIKDFCKKSEELAYYIKAVMKFDMFALDTMPSKDGDLYFLEINPFFGFKGAEQTNSVNVAKHFVEYIWHKINGLDC